MRRPGVPMVTDSLMVWFSMTKAVTSVAVAQQWERGALDPDDLVVRFIPEFGAQGKDGITLRHLLTHTAGIPNADAILQGRPWRESRADNLARIYAAPIEPGWVPGKKAGYHAAAGMSVLGEIVARMSGRPFDEYVREEIFVPLGMNDCWVGMPEDRFAAYGDRIGLMHNTAGSEPIGLRGIDSARATASPMPGANGRGPSASSDASTRCCSVAARATVRNCSRPQTVAAISARHRVAMVDETFGIVSDWGLGFAIDTYITGRHSSTTRFRARRPPVIGRVLRSRARRGGGGRVQRHAGSGDGITHAWTRSRPPPTSMRASRRLPIPVARSLSDHVAVRNG